MAMKANDGTGTPRPYGQGFLMVMLALVAVVALWQFAISGAPVHLEGTTGDLDAAAEQAGKDGKRLLIFATADWCGPCQKLKKDVLAAPEVRERVERDFIFVVLDMSSSRSPGYRYADGLQIHGFPTLIVQNAQRRELGRQVGYIPKAEFLAWLDAAAMPG